MKRLRPKIESDPANPTFLQSVYGVGYRLVRPLAPAGPDDQPPSRVPPAPWPIVGRERELEQVLDALGETRVVNLTGEPGSGKSLLAWECARRASAERRYPGGVWVIPCSGVSSLSALIDQIADLLGTERSADLERLEQRLGLHGEVLIVLDDCDRRHEDGSLAMLRHSSQSARWLITSRIQIATARRLALGPLSREASRALFLQRAAPAVSPSDPDLDHLLRRLEGSPLALVLAASYTSLMTLRQLLSLIHI